MSVIPLTSLQRAHLRSRIAGGDFPDEASYLQWLISLDIERVEGLRSAIQEGLDSGISEQSVEEILMEAKRRHRDSEA